MRGAYALSLIASAALVSSAFLPWLWLGDVRIAGIPDPAGYFVAASGLVGLILGALGLAARRYTGPGLFLVGLAGATTLALVWITGPSTISERAEQHAQAVALVDNVAVQPPPPVTVGAGLIAGMAAACLTMAAGLAAAVQQRRVMPAA
jgi:hypothetical protein